MRGGADEERKLDVRGLFYGIGHQPNSGIVEGQIELDDKGYVVVRTPTPALSFLLLPRLSMLRLQTHRGSGALRWAVGC
jgi:hypothetical protein